MLSLVSYFYKSILVEVARPSSSVSESPEFVQLQIGDRNTILTEADYED